MAKHIARLHLINDAVPDDDSEVLDAYITDEDGASTDLTDMIAVGDGLKLDAGKLRVDHPELVSAKITPTEASGETPTTAEFNAFVSCFNALVTGLVNSKLIVKQG